MWHPERIEQQLQALEQSPKAIASYAGGWYMDGDGNSFGDGWAAPSAPESEMIRGRAPLPRLTTLLVRRESMRPSAGAVLTWFTAKTTS